MPKFNKCEGGAYLFWCPGCECAHSIWTDPNRKGPCWKFNGDVENPTISPSLRVQHHRHLVGDIICHSFIKEGKIQYLNDSTHKLKGKTIEIPDWNNIE